MKTHVDFYRDEAARFGVDSLERRPAGQTAVISRLIADRLPHHGHIVDVGCGDATLLTMLTDAPKRTGIAPSQQEVDALRVLRAGSGIEFAQGLTDSLPFDSESVDVLVCNGVMLFVAEESIPASLREFRRVCRLGAVVFIGELPAAPLLPRPVSILVRAKGAFHAGGALNVVGKVIKNLRNPKALPSPDADLPPVTTIAPEAFGRLCEDAGFAVERTEQLSIPGYATGRWDYLLRAV